MEIRYASHYENVKQYDTETLRKHFLIEDLFVPGKLNMVYSHIDRMIIAAAVPTNTPIYLEGDSKELGSEYFLERRELGIINIGGKGLVTVDGEKYELNYRDGMYVGMGTKEIILQSIDSSNPAKFYMNSGTAHKTYPTVKIDVEKVKKVKDGSDKECNKRTVNKYIHPDICKSCQLVMGMNILETGSVWNTLSAHIHERRMEVYLYFDIDEEDVVFHLMGQPQETRHIVVKNEQAVISPSWSIHSGVGTKKYSFIWGMIGENQKLEDTKHIDMKDLR